jgi:hypothetical protein
MRLYLAAWMVNLRIHFVICDRCLLDLKPASDIRPADWDAPEFFAYCTTAVWTTEKLIARETGTAL